MKLTLRARLQILFGLEVALLLFLPKELASCGVLLGIYLLYTTLWLRCPHCGGRLPCLVHFCPDCGQKIDFDA